MEVEVEVGVGSAWYLEVELAQNRRVLMCSTVGIRLRAFENRGSRYWRGVA